MNADELPPMPEWFPWTLGAVLALLGGFFVGIACAVCL